MITTQNIVEDFIGEFKRLTLESPTYNLRTVHNDNCPYVHMLTFSRNSYMCFQGYKCQDCGYCYYPNQLCDCWDTYFAIKCELCYECVSCTNCYNCDFCVECENCRDSRFCYDCKGCRDCFGCVGLRRKEFHIFNQKYSREEYFIKLKNFDLATLESSKEIENQVENLRLKHPHIAATIIQSENCTGDHILRSKNCSYAFATTESEDCMYVFHNDHLKDVCDTDLMAASELLYECTPGFDMYNCNFCLECGGLRESEFCVRCFNSTNLFGCVTRNHAEFEILNKPYSKEDWYKKVKEIKKQLRKEENYRNFLPEIIPIEW